MVNFILHVFYHYLKNVFNSFCALEGTFFGNSFLQPHHQCRNSLSPVTPSPLSPAHPAAAGQPSCSVAACSLVGQPSCPVSPQRRPASCRVSLGVSVFIFPVPCLPFTRFWATCLRMSDEYLEPSPAQSQLIIFSPSMWLSCVLLSGASCLHYCPVSICWSLKHPQLLLFFQERKRKRTRVSPNLKQLIDPRKKCHLERPLFCHHQSRSLLGAQ